jgi:hypothetical protein
MYQNLLCSHKESKIQIMCYILRFWFGQPIVGVPKKKLPHKNILIFKRIMGYQMCLKGSIWGVFGYQSRFLSPMQHGHGPWGTTHVRHIVWMHADHWLFAKFIFFILLLVSLYAIQYISLYSDDSVSFSSCEEVFLFCPHVIYSQVRVT